MSSIIALFGFLFALFLPGFFVTLIFFREVKLLERIILSVAFSIMVSVAIGIALGYNSEVAEVTGGINTFNVWKWELIITSALGVLAFALNRKSFLGLNKTCGEFFKKLSKRRKEETAFRKL